MNSWKASTTSQRPVKWDVAKEGPSANKEVDETYEHFGRRYDTWQIDSHTDIIAHFAANMLTFQDAVNQKNVSKANVNKDAK